MSACFVLKYPLKNDVLEFLCTQCNPSLFSICHNQKMHFASDRLGENTIYIQHDNKIAIYLFLVHEYKKYLLNYLGTK